MAKVACFAGMMCIAAIVMAMFAAHAEAYVTCGTVAEDLSSCLGYVRTGGAIPETCCNGIRSLFIAAISTLDRQTVCNCLKSAAGAISGVNLNLAAALPGKCGVNVPYKIRPSINCSKVQ
ncbi:non-specific lipid-transfer protein 1-like [Solanum dulcamara]|uniref:non-specific lipid-transfer protein 1-like n=1 Tax=Solanum dulcamara TaxID=45834 RepID=UPI0024863495|nr:non-specific lipid-transfer protein 1-like [Solanum dulcamara]